MKKQMSHKKQIASIMILSTLISVSLLSACAKKGHEDAKTADSSRTAQPAGAEKEQNRKKTKKHGNNPYDKTSKIYEAALKEGREFQEKIKPLPNSATKVKGYPLWTNYELNSSSMAIAFEGDNIWVGTEGGLLVYNLLTDNVVAKYNNKNGLLSNIITDITIDRHGNKWVATHGGGLAKFDGKEWTKYNVPLIGDSFVYQVLFDRLDNMWVATWNGASYYDGKSWKSYFEKDGLVDKWIYSITIDKNDIVWFGTEAGVSRFDGQTWKSYTHKDGLGAGLETLGGYEKIDNTSVHHRTREGKTADGFNPNYVLSAATDQNNVKWFGTWGGGISRFDEKTWTTYTEKDGLPGNFVTDIYIDKDGTVWAGTEKGVGIFDGKKWLSLNEGDGMLGDSIFDIVLDPAGNKWFGTMTGVSKLNGFATREHGHKAL